MTREEVLQLCEHRLHEALAVFGTYSYHDKGPDELIDERELVLLLNSFNTVDQAWILSSLANNIHGISLAMDLYNILLNYDSDELYGELLKLPHGIEITEE